MTPRSQQTANKEQESRRLSPAAAAKPCAYRQETPATEASGEELCPDPGAACLFLTLRLSHFPRGRWFLSLTGNCCNTGIFTYVWLVTNRKTPELCGKVQLINAVS